MSALQVYLNWANSVLSDCDPPVTATVDTIRQGKVLCQLIETFWNAGQDQRLQQWELVSGSSMAIDYIQAVLCHLESNNIKANFTAEDILKGDIKSILDLLWLLILNYNIHDAGTNQYHQCSVGAGRRNILAWCQNILAGLQLDKRCSLVKSLCTNDRFLMLLESTPGLQLPAEDLPTKSQHLTNLLENIESQFGIKKDILSVPELIAGTIDEQILMIYLALLKWKIENKQTKLSHQHLSDLPPRQTLSTHSLSSPSFEQTHYGEIKTQISQLEKQIWPPPRQSASIAESSKKDEGKQTTSCRAAIPTTAAFESGQGEVSISTTPPSQLKTTATIEEDRQSTTAKPFLRTGVECFSFRSDDRETSLEDELAYINNTVPYRSPVRTRLYPRSLTPTMTGSSRQGELRPDNSDFRMSPSLFSRPRSAMGLANWTESYDDMVSTDLHIRSPYSTSLSDKLAKISNTHPQDKYLSRSSNHVGESTEILNRRSADNDNFGFPQRRQNTANEPEDVSSNCNRGHQGTPPLAKDSKDGMYSFKKVIIRKDGDGAKIDTMPMTTEKDDHLELTTSSTSLTTNIPTSENIQRLFIDDNKCHDKEEHTEIKKQKCLPPDWETDHPPPPLLNASPTCPPLFEMEQSRKIKAACMNNWNCDQAVDPYNAEDDHVAPANNSKQTTENPNESKAIEKKMENTVTQYQDGNALPNGDVSSGDSPSNLTAASMTSRKIDILCIEIGELKKKVMAMETGRTSLEDLNRTFHSAMDSDLKIANHHGDAQRNRALGRGTFSKTRSQNQDSISERMNQTWSPTINRLLDLEPELGRDDLRNSSLNSLPSGFLGNGQQEGGMSLGNKENAHSLNSPAGVISSDSSRENKEHLWKCVNRGTNNVIDQRTPLFMGRYMKAQNRDDFSTFSTSVNGSPDSLSEMKINQHVSVDKKQDSKQLFETEQNVSLNNIITHENEGFLVDSPSIALFDIGNENSEVDELLSRHSSGGNMILNRMCSVMRQLKQENDNLKNRLQQEMVKLQMLGEGLQEMRSQREHDSERAQFDVTVQENQTLLQQENVELRERLHIAEEVNAELKADVLKLQQHKTEIQNTQRNLRERILHAEKDKKILSEELNLLWRQRKAMRQSNYGTGTKNTRTAEAEEMNTPPKPKPSLVEAAFSNRLHQADKKSRSPLTSSPAGQRSSVVPFPVSPVSSNNIENQSPDCMFNRHGLGIFYPETPKTYRTVSYLDREKNGLTSKKRPSPCVSSPRKNPGVDSDLELDELLEEVEGHSIAYGDDFDDDSDDYDKDVIQLQKRSRLYWSDENLSRHSENQPGGWAANYNLEQSSRSSSDLHLSQTTTPQNTGRRRMNNVTFNLSNSAGNVPSKQRSILKGILKKASSNTQYNMNGLLDDEYQQSKRSNIPFNQGQHHHPSDDLFLEISQQDFFDPPNFRASNSAQGPRAPGIGKRWSSHESLNSKYSPSARQRDLDERDSAQIFKSPSVNPNDINFSFNDHIPDSPKSQNQQNRTYSTNPHIIRNHALFRHLMRENSMDSSPEARPLFGDPDNSMWSFTPYNFYMETLSRHLNDQNRSTEDANPDNMFISKDATNTTTKENPSGDSNTIPQREKSTVSENSSPVKTDAVPNSVDKSTPAKIGPSANSAGSGGSQKFSAVLSPEQVQFSPTTEADHKAIVRNLCSVFENSDLSLDGSEPGSAKKARTWYDLDKNPPTQLTDEQRTYANTLIEKYTRLPTDKTQQSAM